MSLEPPNGLPARDVVTLREVTRDNWQQVVSLRTRPEQAHFVAPNAFSLAESMYWPDRHPRAVYAGETLIGFAMWAIQPDTGDYWVLRLMIDAQHQGRGYGRAAMVEVLRELRAVPGCDRLRISYEPENKVAEQLYASLGFVKTGEVMEGEVVAMLTFGRPREVE